MISAFGTDFGVHAPRWISRFSDASRQAESYRAGRVLLGQVVRGVSPEGLLDSYHAERHPVGARVLQTMMALTALMRGDARSEALRETVRGSWRSMGPAGRWPGSCRGWTSATTSATATRSWGGGCPTSTSRRATGRCARTSCLTRRGRSC